MRNQIIYRRRGAVIVAALVLSVSASLIVGAAVLVVGRRLAYSRVDIDEHRALFLAEGGVNDELNLISKNLYQAAATARSTQPGTVSGQPYPGRHGTLPGAEGEYWVLTSSDAAGTTAWDGRNSVFYIHSVGRVNGITKRVSINGVMPGTPPGTNPPPPPTPFVSPFNFFAVFGVDNKSGGNPCIQLPGSSSVTVNGTVGTNGTVNRGGSSLSYTSGHNYNASAFSVGSQLTTTPVFARNDGMNWMSTTEVARRTFGVAAGADPWTWLSSNNDNGHVRTYTNSNPSLTAGGTTLAGFPSTPGAFANNRNNSNTLLVKNGSSAGTSLGSWNGLPQISGVRTLIFPPGDYYFSELDLDYNSGTEIILDYGGLTVGGNATRKPIRFWINGAGNTDYVKIGFKMTVPGGTGVASTGDPMGFRVLYNKAASNLNIERDNSYPGIYKFYGAFYAVTDGGSVNIDFRGGNSASSASHLYGALISDRVSFYGTTEIYGPSATNIVANPNDPAFGVKYAANYVNR